MMRDTSLAALHELEASGKAATRRAQILRCVLSSIRPLTRREIATATGIEICSVAGRVNELLKSGALAETYGLMRCPLSGKCVHGVVATPERDRQRELFTDAA